MVKLVNYCTCKRTLNIDKRFKYIVNILNCNASPDKIYVMKNSKAIAALNKVCWRVWKKKHLKLKLNHKCIKPSFSIIYVDVNHGTGQANN